MKKRILCALMAVIMLVSLVPMTALTASAAAVSNDLVEFVKKFEGFTATCHADNTQYSIGYGTKCAGSDADHKAGKVHIITEAEAKAALDKELQESAESVSKFVTKHGLSLSQSQFEALVSFSYNCGTGWMYADGLFRQAVLEGKTGNDFLYAITLWSVGGVGLANRRLCEANMYLNGVYSNEVPANYTYVRFNTEGGSMEYAIQAYDTVEPVGIVEAPTKEGYKFLGWFDAAGNWVTTLNANTALKTLSAKWQKATGGGVQGGAIVGTPVDYVIPGNMATNLNIYKLPGTGAEVIGTFKSGDTLVVVAEYIDIDNVKWVKLDESGWVCVGDVKNPVVQNNNVTVTITSNYINVRQKPSAGATSKIVGKVYLNEKHRVTEVVLVNNKDLWGKIENGWIALMYTNYEKVVAENPAVPDADEKQEVESDGNDTVLATGTVDVTTYVNVRKAPRVTGEIVGRVNDNTIVTIYQTVKDGVSLWGRINTGWICLKDGAKTYVLLDSDLDLPDGSNTGKILATGYVNSNSNLSVRVGPAVNKRLVKTLVTGTKINIYEQVKASNGHSWGRIDPTEDLWVCLTYVSLIDAEEIQGTGTKGTIVNCANGANIRSDAGIANALVGVAPVGSSVTVYQQKTVNNKQWGRIDKGWVCMDYVLLAGTVPGTGTGTGTGTGNGTSTEIEVSGIPTGTIAAESVNVYEKATASSKKVGTLIKGTKITASELVIEEGTSNIWGKTSTGWINMSGVTVNATAVVSTKTGGQLNVRDASCDTTKKAVAKLDNGSEVTISAIKVVNGGIWGQIDAAKGHWISLSLVKLNVKADGTAQPEQKPDTTPKPETPVVKPETTVKTGVIANTNSVNVRSAAGVGNKLVTTLARGTKVTIYEQVTKDNAPWGRIGENQWVAMVYVALDAVNSGTTGGTTGGATGGTTGGTTGSTSHATGIVNSNVNLNVRTGPGTNYPQVASLSKGTKITIYEQKVAQGMTWGRIGENQWVSLSYVTVTGSGSTGTGVMGTIARCYYAVNVRSAPGVGNALVGNIMVGSRVEILEQKAYGGVNWGRVNQGWISMEYVLLDSEIPGGIPGLGTGTGTEQKPEAKPETKPDTSTPAQTLGGTGIVKYAGDKEYLNVLKEAKTGSENVGSLVNGTAVTISEMKVETSTGKVWGHLAQGWVNLAHVDVTITGVVNTKTGGQLNVRDASCDTSKTPVAKLDNGTGVTITAVKGVGEGIWGLIDAEKGHWISLSLVKPGTASNSGNSGNTNNSTNSGNTNTNTNTGNSNTVIGNTTTANGSILYTGTITGTVDGVRIRSTPSTKGTELGKLKNGTGVVIYEVAVAEYMAWGKCDSGWVCLTYVDLKPMKEGAVDTRVVWHENLAIRADAGLNYEQVAAYAKCTVVDIYEIKGNWGRTNDGWVCLDYLLP